MEIGDAHEPGIVELGAECGDTVAVCLFFARNPLVVGQSLLEGGHITPEIRTGFLGKAQGLAQSLFGQVSAPHDVALPVL